MPFLKLKGEGAGDPEVVLKQVGPNSFQLLHGFRYQVPPDGVIYLVRAHDPDRPPTAPNNSTDLASVPFGCGGSSQATVSTRGQRSCTTSS
jgi:hypothetical protein